VRNAEGIGARLDMSLPQSALGIAIPTGPLLGARLPQQHSPNATSHYLQHNAHPDYPRKSDNDIAR